MNREYAQANAQAAMQIQTSFFEAKNTRLQGGSLSPQPIKMQQDLPVSIAYTPKPTGSKHAEFVQKASKINQERQNSSNLKVHQRGQNLDAMVPQITLDKQASAPPVADPNPVTPSKRVIKMKASTQLTNVGYTPTIIARNQIKATTLTNEQPKLLNQFNPLQLRLKNPAFEKTAKFGGTLGESESSKRLLPNQIHDTMEEGSAGLIDLKQPKAVTEEQIQLGLQRIDIKDADNQPQPSPRYLNNNKIELSNVVKRRLTIDNESNSILKKNRDRERPKQRIVSEKQRRINTIVVDEDAKIASNLQPSQRIFLRQNSQIVHNEEGAVYAKNESKEVVAGSRTNQEFISGAGYVSDPNLQSQQMQLYNQNQSMVDRFSKMKRRFGAMQNQNQPHDPTSIIMSQSEVVKQQDLKDEIVDKAQKIGISSRHSQSVSPSKQRRENNNLNNIAQRRISANFGFQANNKQQTGQTLTGESENAQSLFTQFKQQMGQENKRQTFMKLHKLDSGLPSDDNRMNLIMTPIQIQGSDKRLSELEMSKCDMSNNSHYHRFKRNSVGYQSQGSHIYGNGKGSLMYIEPSGSGIGIAREASQTAFGVGQFAANSRGKQPPSILLNQAAPSSEKPPQQIDLNSSLGNPLSQRTSIISHIPSNANATTPNNGTPMTNHTSPSARFRRNLSLNNPRLSSHEVVDQQQTSGFVAGNIVMIKNFNSDNTIVSPYRKLAQHKAVGQENSQPPSLENNHIKEKSQAGSQPVRIQDYIQSMRAQQS